MRRSGLQKKIAAVLTAALLTVACTGLLIPTTPASAAVPARGQSGVAGMSVAKSHQTRRAESSPPPIVVTKAPPVSDLPGGQNPGASGLPPLNGSYNLANNASYVIGSQDRTDPAFHEIETKAYPGPVHGLTQNSLIWTGFLRQSGRSITVKLNQPGAVTAISVQFYQDTSMGILFPSKVQFEVSPDGNSWYAAGTADSLESPYDQGKLIQTYQIGVNQVEAAYIRIVFPVDVWVLVRDLRVEGSPLLTPTTTHLPYATNGTEAAGYLIPSQATTAGVHNMLLVYSGANGAAGTWTPADFTPMVAYTTLSGQVSGRMFDSFLFLPYGSSLTTVNGWESYMNNLFAPGEQLSALNQTVATLEPQLQQLGISEPTVNVVLSIPYPNDSITNFGALPGTSNSLTFSASQVGTNTAYADRSAAIEWYVQALLARFAQAGFTHLKLVGLYWDSESIVYTAPLEANLIQTAVQLTHEAGLKLFWIPTFDASGLLNWKQFGFDDVTVQSNFIETPSLPISRVTEAASTAYQNGLGMEVEASEDVLTSQSQRDRYYNQLVADHLAGAEGNVLHTFYDASQVLTQAAQSTDPNIRNLYVETYDFLIGQFTNNSYIVY